MSRVGLSVVVPMFNEAATLRELVARCRAAAAASDPDYEIVLVDDGSTDETPRLLAELCDGERVRSLRPPHNVGQFRATQRGLAAARGELVCVLDADLQDPPELIADLVAQLRAAPATRAVFAIKQRRDDPQPFLAAQAVFHRLQALLSASPIPRGASSCGVMRCDAAALVAAADAGHGNLGAVLATARVRIDGLPFVRARRRDGGSRLGGLGHVSEAVASLAMTGALSQLSLIGAAVGAAVGALLQRTAWRVPGLALLVVAAALVVGAVLAHAFRRRVLASLARHRRAPA